MPYKVHKLDVVSFCSVLITAFGKRARFLLARVTERRKYTGTLARTGKNDFVVNLADPRFVSVPLPSCSRLVCRNRAVD